MNRICQAGRGLLSWIQIGSVSASRCLPRGLGCRGPQGPQSGDLANRQEWDFGQAPSGLVRELLGAMWDELAAPIALHRGGEPQKHPLKVYQVQIKKARRYKLLVAAEKLGPWCMCRGRRSSTANQVGSPGKWDWNVELGEKTYKSCCKAGTWGNRIIPDRDRREHTAREGSPCFEVIAVWREAEPLWNWNVNRWGSENQGYLAFLPALSSAGSWDSVSCVPRPVSVGIAVTLVHRRCQEESTALHVSRSSKRASLSQTKALQLCMASACGCLAAPSAGLRVPICPRPVVCLFLML